MQAVANAPWRRAADCDKDATVEAFFTDSLREPLAKRRASYIEGRETSACSYCSGAAKAFAKRRARAAELNLRAKESVAVGGDWVIPGFADGTAWL